MRYDVAPCRLLIWLAAAVLGWAVVICTVLFLPQALAGFAVAGVLLWRKGQRPVSLGVPADLSTLASTAPAVAVRPREDVRALVAQSI